MNRILLAATATLFAFQAAAQTQDEHVLQMLINQLQLQHKIMCALRSADVAKNPTLKSTCDELLATVVKRQKELAGAAK